MSEKAKSFLKALREREREIEALRRENRILRGMVHKLPYEEQLIVGYELMDYGKIVARVRRRHAEAEGQRRDARRLCDRLLALPPERQARRIRKTRWVLRSMPLLFELLRRSKEKLFENPGEAARLAELAWRVGLRLAWEPAVCGGWEALCDLHALTLAHRANALRVACRWEEAAYFFDHAFDRFGRGTCDELVRAEILSLHASFLKDRQRFDEALGALRSASRIYARYEKDHLRGKVLLQVAAVQHCRGAIDQALRMNLQACELLDDRLEPTLVAASWNNLAIELAHLGEHHDALGALRSAEEIFARFPPGSSVHLNRAWVTGIVFTGLGRIEEAAEAFEEARQGYLRLGNPYNVALVSLELAVLAHGQKRHADVRRLAEETYTLLRPHAFHREVMAAVQLVCQEARERRATEEIIQAAIAKLREHPGPRNAEPPGRDAG